MQRLSRCIIVPNFVTVSQNRSDGNAMMVILKMFHIDLGLENQGHLFSTVLRRLSSCCTNDDFRDVRPWRSRLFIFKVSRPVIVRPNDRIASRTDGHTDRQTGRQTDRPTDAGDNTYKANEAER